MTEQMQRSNRQQLPTHPILEIAYLSLLRRKEVIHGE